MRSLQLLCLFFLSIQLHAQNNKGTLSGKLTDSTGKNPIPLATITVFKAKDTSIITYRLSDPNGNFKVPGLPIGLELRTVITSSGLGVYRKEFQFTASQLQIDLGTLKMEPDIKSLDEVLVFSERPPVIMRNDTIEFNASAFKTLPSALVEDLLKKLPGVDIDLDGSIKVNNRQVNRILVDGKAFFGGDPKIATRNLPANLLDKVQVVDDKEELDRNPNKSKNELGQVINLKLKKSIKKGWFGKAYMGAGAGSDRGQYESGAIINSFRDTFQLSILGYANNINRAGFGFEDLDNIGGYRRSGFNNVGDGGNESIGSAGTGLQKSNGAGLNFNHDPTSRLSWSLQYFFGQTNTDYRSKSNSKQFFSDSILETKTSSESIHRYNNHRIGAKVSWKIDSFSTLTFNPGITFMGNSSQNNYFSESFNSHSTKLNESDNSQRFLSDGISYSYNLSYSHGFRKSQRMIFASSSMYYGNNISDLYSDAENVFYSNPTTVTTINQNRQKRNDYLRMATNVNFNEPLGKKKSFRIEEMFNYFKDGDRLNTYEWNPVSGKYEILNDNLSNELNRKGIKNNVTISLDLDGKAARFSPGISIQSISIKNRFLKNPRVDQEYFYVFPSLNFYIKNFNGGYRVQINEPSAYDLQPVVDNSDPIYQNFGNTELVPAIQHMFNMGFNKYDGKRSISFNVSSNIIFVDHSIIRERSVDSRGVQITRPLNVNGSRYAYLNFGLSKQYKLKNNLRISIRPALNFNYDKSFIIVNTIKSSYTNLNLRGLVTSTINWNDLVELNQRYSVTKQKSNYGSSTFQNLSFISHFSTTEFVVRFPKNWVWESSLDHRYNQQPAPGFSKNIFRWNAGINYLFLKEKKGQARLYVYDILKQNTNASRDVSENFIHDIETNTLTRFFLLSFTYNIREFKGGKVGGRNNFFWF